MTTARTLRSQDASTRYFMKEVDAPLGNVANVTPQWMLKVLEEHHEEGWEVCGVTTTRGSVLIYYRRV